ncbi:uncharacterized protein LY89DRAFT_611468 [Mollisia scopiformis]|uniref:Uncharacterized protein n=1 Tax=Mollisia scopiformis TaxID=149040 RepID=A0A194XHL6_MOLSC|nr:uncharacterized protein LY89DRAFT_611468 [Mollisia scopiformis]KUJ19705.1 hypothetical protein LY89DRAFT_611468 [Mollisia scopiformis]
MGRPTKKMPSEEAYEPLSHEVASDGDISLQASRSLGSGEEGASPVASMSPFLKQQVNADSESVEPKNPETETEIYNTYFSRKKEFGKLLLAGFVRILLTIFLIGCIYATLATYGGRSVIGPVGKRVFNALVTGLSMILGISIASSFKAIAIDVRWWILSRKRRPIHEVDAILSSHALSEVSKLAIRSAKDKKPGVVMSAALWVLFNIAAQAAVAMLGLTYSLNAQVDPTRPILGDTSFSNFSSSFGVAVDEDTTASSQLAAHTFGEMALQFPYLEASGPDQLPVDYLSPCDLDSVYYEGQDYFQTAFQEYSATDSTTGCFYSNRSLITTSSCNAYSVIGISNGTSQTFQYERDSQTLNQTWHSIGPNSTTYLTYPDKQDCGPRCATVYIYENDGTSANYFECTVNASTIYNATVQEQQLSDDHARLAAGAIALQGYQSDSNNASQYQQFPSQSTYGNFTSGNSTFKARQLRQYAIGVLVVADTIFPQIGSDSLHVLGLQPQPGLKLSIDHVAYMWAIFGSIAGSHLVLWIIGSYVASRVAVIENSYLKIALALRPVTDDLEEQGLLMGGHKHEHGALDRDVVYGPREQAGSGARALEISRVASCVRESRQWEGYYDS